MKTAKTNTETETPSRSLAIIEKATVPKPKQSEVVAALVKIKLEQMHAEKAAAEKRHEALKDECHAILKAVATSKFAAKAEVGSFYFDGCRDEGELRRAEVKVQLVHSDFTPAQIVKLRACSRAGAEANIYIPHDIETQLRKRITASLKQETPPAERVQTMLADPETKRALAALLSAIDPTAQKTIEA